MEWYTKCYTGALYIHIICKHSWASKNRGAPHTVGMYLHWRDMTEKVTANHCSSDISRLLIGSWVFLLDYWSVIPYWEALALYNGFDDVNSSLPEDTWINFLGFGWIFRGNVWFHRCCFYGSRPRCFAVDFLGITPCSLVVGAPWSGCSMSSYGPVQFLINVHVQLLSLTLHICKDRFLQVALRQLASAAAHFDHMAETYHAILATNYA